MHYNKSIYYYKAIILFLPNRQMSCYLKISYLNRHRKYRYYQDRPINLHQIRKELFLNLPAQCIQLHLQRTLNNQQKEHPQTIHIQLRQHELCDYLRGLAVQDKETIKIKIVEDMSKAAQNRPENEDFAVPNQIQRINSKSQEVKIETASFQISTDIIQVTQQFLCQSTMDRIESIESFKSSIKPNDILRELQQNLLRQKDLQKKRRFKNIPQLYSQIKSTIEADFHLIQ